MERVASGDTTLPSVHGGYNKDRALVRPIKHISTFLIGSALDKTLGAFGAGFRRRVQHTAELRGLHVALCEAAIGMREETPTRRGEFFKLKGTEGVYRFRSISPQGRVQLTQTSHSGKGRFFVEEEFEEEMERVSGFVIADISAAEIGMSPRVSVYRVASDSVRAMSAAGLLKRGELHYGTFITLREACSAHPDCVLDFASSGKLVTRGLYKDALSWWKTPDI